MIRFRLYMIFVILIFSVPISGQEGLNYQMTLISNPAVTGSAGDGIVRLSYLNNYPGNNFNLHSLALSYDSFFPALHGGAGFWLSDDYLGGIINNLKGGISYSYFLRAAQDLYISAGLSASFYHRGYDLGGMILPDQIDPLLGSVMPSGETFSERGKTVFDLATGFLFIYGKFFGGFSINHLAEPDPASQADADGKLRRILLVHGAGNFSIKGENQFRLLPLASIETGKGLFSAGAGVSAEFNYLAISAILFTDNSENIDIQTGFSIKTGKIMLFYNYRFNIVSGESLLPFSLLHHTGIALSLNNVDKRKTVKTINFPNL